MESDLKKDYCLYKSSICFYKNNCNKGKECKFAHTNQELEPIKCWYEYNDKCENEKCVFWHKQTEIKEDFYQRTNKTLLINGKKVYTLKNKIEDKKLFNKKIENKKNIIKKLDLEIDKKLRLTDSLNEEKINNDNFNLLNISTNKEEKVNENMLFDYTLNDILVKQKSDDIVYFTPEDNKTTPISDNLITISIEKCLNKEDFINYYNNLSCEILYIEKNNKDYKVVIRGTKEEINNILKNEEDDNNNLPF